MPVGISCENCGKEFFVRPARADTARFCSYKCRSEWRSKNWQGANHPNWHDEPREKSCEQCGAKYRQGPTEAISSFRKRKFCSSECSRIGQVHLEGEAHPNYNPDSRRNNRRGKHGAWARAVISRDKATCQHCGVQGVELHAHHIKSFKDHPELRWELSNGLTLCHSCHWKAHTASAANGVNSGNPLTDNAEGNPEPSFGRKPIEGVTTRGRAYRRWEGNCDWCGAFISKRWSDTTGKKHLFCSKHCAGKFNAANRTYRRWKNPERPGQ